MVKLENLRLFIEVALAGRLSDAANKLHRTQSAVSTTLKHLETDLGEKLFMGERKNALTPFGEFVLQQAQALLQEYDKRLDAIRLYASGKQGVVRVASVPSVALLLPDILHDLYDTNSLLQIQLHDYSSADVIKAVRAMDVDFGVASPTEEMDDLHTELLATDPFGCVCPVDHPFAQLQRPITWDDLHGYNFISNRLCYQIKEYAVRKLVSKARLLVYNTTSLFAFVENGYGVTLLPQMSYMLAPKLKFLPLADTSVMRKILLISRAGKVPSPATAQVIDLLRNHFAAQGEETV